jgi:hypothetical protein
MHRDLRATNPTNEVIDVTPSFSSPDNAEELEVKACACRSKGFLNFVVDKAVCIQANY